jgi:hypothetical protein
MNAVALIFNFTKYLGIVSKNLLVNKACWIVWGYFFVKEEAQLGWVKLYDAKSDAKMWRKNVPYFPFCFQRCMTGTFLLKIKMMIAPTKQMSKLNDIFLFLSLYIGTYIECSISFMYVRKKILIHCPNVEPFRWLNIFLKTVVWNWLNCIVAVVVEKLR